MFTRRLIAFAITALTVASPFTITHAQNGWPTRLVRNGFDRNNRNPEVMISDISLKRATDLFQEFKRSNIPFGYPVDGASFRAAEMSRLAQRAGITMGHTFAEGNLQVRTRYPRYPHLRWGWHVAPSVYVTQPDGRSILMVLDPTIAEMPLTVLEWERLMQVADPNANDNYEPLVDRTKTGTRHQMHPDDITRLQADPDDAVRSQLVLSRLREFQDNPASIPANMREAPAAATRSAQ